MFVSCPICGQRVRLRAHEANHVETHGLDCGPYEHFHDEWYECPACGAKFTDDEVEEAAV